LSCAARAVRAVWACAVDWEWQCGSASGSRARKWPRRAMEAARGAGAAAEWIVKAKGVWVC